MADEPWKGARAPTQGSLTVREGNALLRGWLAWFCVRVALAVAIAGAIAAWTLLP